MGADLSRVRSSNSVNRDRVVVVVVNNVVVSGVEEPVRVGRRSILVEPEIG